MKFSETLAKVIDLATAIHNYWDTELPKRHPNYPMIAPGEDSGPPPPEEKQLKDFLMKLPEDDIYKLVLIMHLERGDFRTDDLAGHYETLKDRFEKPDWEITQMMGNAALAEYLTDGLAEAKKRSIDVDQLSFASIAARK